MSASSASLPPVQSTSSTGQDSGMPRQPPSPVRGRWWPTKGIVDAAEADTEVETSTQSGTQPDDAEGIRDPDRRRKLKRRRASKRQCVPVRCLGCNRDRNIHGSLRLPVNGVSQHQNGVFQHHYCLCGVKWLRPSLVTDVLGSIRV
jgi:hypothetical protein